MIKKGTYKKEEVLAMMKDFGHFVSQNNKRTIWRKGGVEITARYWDLLKSVDWKVSVKKIA